MLNWIIKLSDGKKLLLLILLHFVGTGFYDFLSFGFKEGSKDGNVSALAHFLFFTISLCLFHFNRRLNSKTITWRVVLLILFLILNSIPFQLYFDSFWGGEFSRGIGWPSTFYWFDPFMFFEPEKVDINETKRSFSNLFYNLYFASIALAIVSHLIERRIVRMELKIEESRLH